jgi:hypothetical protein
MFYNVDPPGYTEKNAYFGIKSPLAKYIVLGSSASEKGPALLASPPLPLARNSV